MDISKIMGSSGLWIACSVMVITVIIQSIIYFRSAMKFALHVGLSPDQCKRGIRSALITAFGPSFSPVIVMLSLIAVLGAPTTWMRMNDIGAARTELAITRLSVAAMGGDIAAGSLTAEMFDVAVWGMALNNVGWMLVALILTPRMAGAISWMNEKYDRSWINLMMSASMVGVFGYLSTNELVAKSKTIFKDSPYLMAALSAAASMLLITKLLRKYPRMQELSLGISMLVGMTVGSLFG